MQHSRARARILFQGAENKLYQDVLSITLRNRRALPLILDTLRASDTTSVAFHFWISSNSAEDLPKLFELLPVPVPDWYQEFQLPMNWQPMGQPGHLAMQITMAPHRGADVEQ